MKILTGKQIREWDNYTIQHEPVASIDLMERAARACFQWVTENGLAEMPVAIFCTKGNNGGDGLALARMLSETSGYVEVYILEIGQQPSLDFLSNLNRLIENKHVKIQRIHAIADVVIKKPETLIIDAIFGSGLSRPPEGLAAGLIQLLNQSGNRIISIDIPSGMFTDQSSLGNPIIQAADTLSFQCMKPAFLMAENSDFTGNIHILDIGLHPVFLNQTEIQMQMTSANYIRSVYKARSRFSHKGSFGHALLVTGSYGKMGAAILCVKACLRSGAGLVTCHISESGYEIMQKSVPEAMVITDDDADIITSVKTDLSLYSSVGIGPGIGTDPRTIGMLNQLLVNFRKPLVLDADALNGLAEDQKLIRLIPERSILTPHPKEFERLFGKAQNDFDRVNTALKKASELNCIIILKGHHTCIAVPGGKAWFNSTGNAGMATAGSGDVLTGILTGLLAQGYESEQAAVLGVYVHGLAGDFAAAASSQESLIASDLIENLGKAFSNL